MADLETNLLRPVDEAARAGNIPEIVRLLEEMEYEADFVDWDALATSREPAVPVRIAALRAHVDTANAFVAKGGLGDRSKWKRVEEECDSVLACHARPAR